MSVSCCFIVYMRWWFSMLLPTCRQRGAKVADQASSLCRLCVRCLNLANASKGNVGNIGRDGVPGLSGPFRERFLSIMLHCNVLKECLHSGSQTQSHGPLLSHSRLKTYLGGLILMNLIWLNLFAGGFLTCWSGYEGRDLMERPIGQAMS